MMEDIIKKSISFLLQHGNEIENVGLNGQMSIVVLLYEYSSHNKNLLLEEKAGDILDEIIQNVNNSLPNDFYKGITGITYALNYLNCRYMIQCEEDVFPLLEDNIFSSEQLQISTSSSTLLFTPGIYLASILSDKNIRKYENVIDYLINSCKYYFLIIKNHINKPLVFVNSILYFLNILGNFEKYEEEVERLAFRIFTSLSEKEYTSDSMSDKLTLERIISKNPHFKNYHKAIVAKLDIRGADLTKQEIMDNIWQHLLYFQDEKIIIEKDRLIDIIQTLIVNRDYVKLSWVILAIIKCPLS